MRRKKYLISIAISSLALCSLVISSCSSNQAKPIKPTINDKEEVENFINSLGQVNLAPTDLGKRTLPKDITSHININDYVNNIPTSSQNVTVQVNNVTKQNNNDGTLAIVLMYSKGQYSTTREYTVFGFKTTDMQDSEDIKNFIDSLNINLTPTELGKVTLPESINNPNTIDKYINGIPQTQNGITISTIKIINQNDIEGSLEIVLKFKKNKVEKVSEYRVTGFKKTGDLLPPTIDYSKKLDDEIKRFNLILKPNKIIDQLLPSTLKDMNKFREYFEWEEKNSFTYHFTITPNDKEGKLKVSVTITVLDDKGAPVYDDEKRFPEFTGFRKQVNPEDHNKEILKKALEALKITKKEDISKITTNEYLENKFDYFNKYFKVNKEEVERLGQNIYVDLRPSKTEVKRGEFETIIFTHKVLVGEGNNRISGVKEFKISGFKQLLSELDSSQPINLSTPQGAKSYKGLIQPLPKLSITSSENYKNSLKSFDWEKYKIEMIYQARFYMYQIFNDNFSEINYYTFGDKKEGDEFSTVAEAIIKKDMLNLTGYIQSYGNTVKFTKDFHAGQKVKLVINQRKSNYQNDWRPIDAIIMPFSFSNNCADISGNSIPVWGSLMSSDRSFTWNLSLDDKELARSIETWNMRTYLFTIARKR